MKGKAVIWLQTTKKKPFRLQNGGKISILAKFYQNIFGGFGRII